MLLTGYTREIFRPECNPSFESVHCVARLNEDISPVLPYLNAVLGGTQYFDDPPEVMFHHHGRLIKVGGSEIAINALEDADEADRILAWLQKEINRTWDNRGAITPSHKARPKPQLLEVLRLLPRTNCKKCNRPTCMVFAAQVVEGGRNASHCPELSDTNRARLVTYLADFEFE